MLHTGDDTTEQNRHNFHSQRVHGVALYTNNSFVLPLLDFIFKRSSNNTYERLHKRHGHTTIITAILMQIPYHKGKA